MKVISFLILASLFMLSACGYSKADRAETGALIGGAGGAVVGATVGHPLTGAAIGAAGGAAVGAATDPSKINLGKPIWR